MLNICNYTKWCSQLEQPKLVFKTVISISSPCFLCLCCPFTLTHHALRNEKHGKYQKGPRQSWLAGWLFLRVLWFSDDCHRLSESNLPLPFTTAFPCYSLINSVWYNDDNLAPNKSEIELMLLLERFNVQKQLGHSGRTMECEGVGAKNSFIILTNVRTWGPWGDSLLSPFLDHICYWVLLNICATCVFIITCLVLRADTKISGAKILAFLYHLGHLCRSGFL